MLDRSGVLACEFRIFCSPSKLPVRDCSQQYVRPASLRSPFMGIACKVLAHNFVAVNHVALASRRIRCSKVDTKAQGVPYETSSNKEESSSVFADPQPLVLPVPYTMGSPFFWIGVGIGFSALISLVAKKLKNYAMNQALTMLTGQQSLQNNQFNDVSGSAVVEYPLPDMSASPSRFDIPLKPLSTPTCQSTDPRTTLEHPVTGNVPTDQGQTVIETVKPAFSDVSPNDACLESHFEAVNIEQGSSIREGHVAEVSDSGGSSNQEASAPVSQKSTSKRDEGSNLSVEAIERLMEDPAMQNMIYPYLPESMRNPKSFKWMMQNPQYRKELEATIKSISQGSDLSNSTINTLKNFSFKNPQVKQQFDQLGITPQEAMSRIMTDPEVATAFRNPRVMRAIMECAQNPTCITKYQNDFEVMGALAKVSKLFPGLQG